jgi:hypothetical protein
MLGKIVPEYETVPEVSGVLINGVLIKTDIIGEKFVHSLVPIS